MKGVPGVKGFTLLEVLIALVVIAVGLLGLAALQSQAQQAEIESYQRSQALIILGDIVNRMNTNRQAVDCYSISDAATGTPFVGTGNTTTYGCSGFGDAETRALADGDLADLNDILKGGGEDLSGTKTGAMIGGRACISGAAGVYTVEVAWQGLMDTMANTTSLCGQGLYGAETRRRVVIATVRIANLS